MGSAEERIMDALKAMERESGLGRRAFARSLNVSPALWVLSCNGQKHLGARLAVAAAQADAGLEPLVMFFLRFELPIRNRKMRVGNTAIS